MVRHILFCVHGFPIWLKVAVGCNHNFVRSGLFGGWASGLERHVMFGGCSVLGSYPGKGAISALALLEYWLHCRFAPLGSHRPSGCHADGHVAAAMSFVSALPPTNPAFLARVRFPYNFVWETKAEAI